MIDYAVILRNKRIALGYNQQKLAELAGISQPFLNQIETKAKKPSIDVFFRLCEVLGLEVNILEKQNNE